MATEYVIEESPNRERLAELVVERLRDGWQLQGGVSTALLLSTTSYGSVETHWWYAQALTREDVGRE
jgi:hypothetical protein